jgi:hypothetical protein
VDDQIGGVPEAQQEPVRAHQRERERDGLDRDGQRIGRHERR